MSDDPEIIELQTRIAFQDGTLQELSDVIARQQQAIEALQKELEELRCQLRTLQPSEVTGGSEPPPPHY